MKILICGSVPSFSYHDEELLVKEIEKELLDAGNIVDTFLLPFKHDILSLLDQIMLYQMLNVSEADLLITVGYPACTIPHKNKVIYLMETIPDLFERFNLDNYVFKNKQYLDIKDKLICIEKRTFYEAQKVFCGSTLFLNDLQQRYVLNGEVLVPPELKAKVNELELPGQTDISNCFITECILSPETGMLDMITNLRNLNDKLFVFVPSADFVYYGAVSRVIEKKGASDKIKLIKSACPEKLISSANVYLHFDNNVRFIKGAVIRSIAAGIPIVYTDDCGAARELLQNYNNAFLCERKNMVSEANKITTSYSKKKVTDNDNIIVNSKHFVERLVFA